MEDRRTRRLFERQRRRAERLKMLAEGPPSPCISVCRINDHNGLCAGCFRSIDEIRDWMIMPPAERHKVLAELKQRRMGTPPAVAGGHGGDDRKRDDEEGGSDPS
jgi:predicted Fe-S protein YdhL (DUF1289 family)